MFRKKSYFEAFERVMVEVHLGQLILARTVARSGWQLLSIVRSFEEGFRKRQPMLSEPLETQLKANEKDGGVDEEMTDPRAVQGACMVIEPRPPSSPDRHE